MCNNFQFLVYFLCPTIFHARPLSFYLKNQFRVILWTIDSNRILVKCFGTKIWNSIYVFRNVLQKAYDLRLETVAMCVINCVSYNYPPNEGAHTALREY